MINKEVIGMEQPTWHRFFKMKGDRITQYYLQFGRYSVLEAYYLRGKEGLVYSLALSKDTKSGCRDICRTYFYPESTDKKTEVIGDSSELLNYSRFVRSAPGLPKRRRAILINIVDVLEKGDLADNVIRWASWEEKDAAKSRD